MYGSNGTQPHPLALFPGHRRNGLATVTSSNRYFCCQKFGISNSISEHHHLQLYKLLCHALKRHSQLHVYSIAVVHLIARLS